MLHWAFLLRDLAKLQLFRSLGNRSHQRRSSTAEAACGHEAGSGCSCRDEGGLSSLSAIEMQPMGASKTGAEDVENPSASAPAPPVIAGTAIAPISAPPRPDQQVDEDETPEQNKAISITALSAEEKARRIENIMSLSSKTYSADDNFFQGVTAEELDEAWRSRKHPDPMIVIEDLLQAHGSGLPTELAGRISAFEPTETDLEKVGAVRKYSADGVDANGKPVVYCPLAPASLQEIFTDKSTGTCAIDAATAEAMSDAFRARNDSISRRKMSYNQWRLHHLALTEMTQQSENSFCAPQSLFLTRTMGMRSTWRRRGWHRNAVAQTQRSRE